MRRADRLFQIVQLLRGGCSLTARQISRRLEVSDRTIYRDVRDLTLSGVPIEGEPGVGYLLRHFDIPPLMFTRDEIEALVAGARMVEAWGDGDLGKAARDALLKIEAALPERLRERIAKSRIYAPAFHVETRTAQTLGLARQAINNSKRLTFQYLTKDATASHRTVRPAGLFFWGAVWTLVAWCELRRDFRNFRLDRMTGATFGATFEGAAGQRLEDFLARIPREGGDPS